MTEKREEYQVKVMGDMVQVDRPTSVELYGHLSMPMPAEALKMEDSRGFPLTSIKAGFVIERLNQTFGLLGYGWRYFPGPARIEGAKDEVLVDVAFQWRVSEEGSGNCPPVYWGHRIIQGTGEVVEGWYLDKELPAVWSEPIIATGGSSTNRKGSVPMADAHKGALTNSLTKAASRLGVGIEIWKGESDTPSQGNKHQSQKRKPRAKKTPAKTGNGPTTLAGIKKWAEAEWGKLTCEDGKVEGKEVQTLARQMDKVGLKMQSTRLIHVLFGEGELTHKRVLAATNVTTSSNFGEEAVKLLNSAAWVEEKEETKDK